MMGLLLYYLVILPLSYLPFGVLYVISDGLYLIIYDLFKYRRSVVAGNLARSFPEKSEEERLDIERKFYRHLCDLVVEGIKGFSISYSQVQKRMKVRDAEVLDRHFDAGKSVIIVGGHYGNWELFALAVDRNIKHKAVALYTPISNAFMDGKVRKSRSKYGLFMLSISQIREQMSSAKEQLTVTIFGSDQAPGPKQRAYWMTFLHQETPVQFGTEKFAKEHDLPVVLGTIYKLKRGYYEVRFEHICDNPIEQPYGWITETHTRMLEDIIRKQPEYWLWSHKRWKRKRPEGEEMMNVLGVRS